MKEEDEFLEWLDKRIKEHELTMLHLNDTPYLKRLYRLDELREVRSKYLNQNK